MKRLFAKLGIVDKESFWNFAKQFMQFALVGVSNTLISLGIYYLLLHFNVYYIIAHVVGFLISVLNSFFWNSRFVFRRQTHKKIAFFKTLISYGVTFLLSTSLLYLMVDIIGVPDKIAPIINMFITTPLNFLLNKFWAFGKKKDTPPDPE